MECPDHVGDREDQSNSNGNEEIQLGSTGNQRNLLDPSWTTKAKYRRDAAVLRRIMEDVRIGREADIASDQYQLMVTKMKLKLKKNWTTGETVTQRYNMTSLQDTNKLNEFKITLNNRFQALQDLLKEETTVEENWNAIKEALTLTCQEVLGCKKRHHREWISMGTLDKIQERKNKKTAINNKRESQGTSRIH
ncbi:unnamed protein product [Schistosoma curassoni]|uniref:Reverse transcriptase domain-containing protein n=1 Tax=Schistosoma curassoni TaxID=6186 RepID=A0A183KXD0_9TREM|nr:unnamed protein product [Schistosoma curassoni]